MAVFLISFAVPAYAQNGDRKDQPQPAVDKRFNIPPAPILSPTQEQATFQLPPGYRIELCASDPLIHDPVDIAFDAEGRLWVVEMRGLMPNVDGEGELEPIGSIATLSDKDGDGVFEDRRTFADRLILPRGICHGFDGVIAVLPPQLVWMKDHDGDGKVDEQVVIDESPAFGAGLDNPEHAPNAPRMGLDNWLYLINHNWRYRFIGGKWEKSRIHRRGQWGAARDDRGRQVYNYNSTPLHGDLVPPHYVVRNPAIGLAKGTNVRLLPDGQIYSRRLNLGVNRGYLPETLRENGHLRTYTAACGPAVFRGTALLPEDRGATFVCEPAANLVRRNFMVQSQGRVSGEAARGEFDFLTSTDERFRPVNLANGPDGALYVVDLYRGILQHRVFLTSFLRRQIEERGLDKGIHLGRIWRIVHDSGALDTGAAPAKLDTFGLVAALASRNGWRRDTAQRLLTEKPKKTWANAPKTPQQGEPERMPLDSAQKTEEDLIADSEGARSQSLRVTYPDPISALQQRAFIGEPLERLHCIWTLEGLEGAEAIPDSTITKGLEEREEPFLLAQWIRLSEHRTAPEHLAVWLQIAHLGRNGEDRGFAPQVSWQLAHSLGERPVPDLSVYDGLAIFADPLAMAPDLLLGREDDAILRQGLLSGLAHRELDLYGWLDPSAIAWDARSPSFSFPQTVREIGEAVAKRGNYTEIVDLIRVASNPSFPENSGALARTQSDRPGTLYVNLQTTAGAAPQRDETLARPGALALLQGFSAGLAKSKLDPFEQPAPPDLLALVQSPAQEIAALGRELETQLIFAAPPIGLDPTHSKARKAAHTGAVARGKTIYSITCVACHQPDGRGIPDLAPPLGDPSWLGKSDEALSRIVVEGLSGEITVEGQPWNIVMPPWGHLTDIQVADVLTYVLAEFGDGKENLRTVEPSTVRSIR